MSAPHVPSIGAGIGFFLEDTLWFPKQRTVTGADSVPSTRKCRSGAQRFQTPGRRVREDQEGGDTSRQAYLDIPGRLYPSLELPTCDTGHKRTLLGARQPGGPSPVPTVTHAQPESQVQGRSLPQSQKHNVRGGSFLGVPFCWLRFSSRTPAHGRRFPCAPLRTMPGSERAPGFVLLVGTVGVKAWEADTESSGEPGLYT